MGPSMMLDRSENDPLTCRARSVFGANWERDSDRDWLWLVDGAGPLEHAASRSAAAATGTKTDRTGPRLRHKVPRRSTMSFQRSDEGRSAIVFPTKRSRLGEVRAINAKSLGQGPLDKWSLEFYG